MSGRLGSDARDAIARELASGIRPVDVARAHSMAPESLRALLANDDDMKSRVASYKELMDLRAQQLIAKTWLAANDSIDNIIAISRDRSDRKCYDANVYLIDKVWPTKQVIEQNNTHQLSADLTLRLIEGLELMRKVNHVDPEASYSPDNDPHLLDGADVTYGDTPNTDSPDGAPL